MIIDDTEPSDLDLAAWSDEKISVIRSGEGGKGDVGIVHGGRCLQSDKSNVIT